jgi:hypothetical protein
MITYETMMLFLIIILPLIFGCFLLRFLDGYLGPGHFKKAKETKKRELGQKQD